MARGYIPMVRRAGSFNQHLRPAFTHYPTQPAHCCNVLRQFSFPRQCFGAIRELDLVQQQQLTGWPTRFKTTCASAQVKIATFCMFNSVIFLMAKPPFKILIVFTFWIAEFTCSSSGFAFCIFTWSKRAFAQNHLYQWGHQGGWWWQNKGGREGQLCYSYLDFQRNIEHRCARTKQVRGRLKWQMA